MVDRDVIYRNFVMLKP